MTDEELRVGLPALLRAYAEPYRFELAASDLRFYADALGRYRLADIIEAFKAHTKDTRRGSFFPKPAELIRNIEQAQQQARLRAETTHKLAPPYRSNTKPRGYLTRKIVLYNERFDEIYQREGREAAEAWWRAQEQNPGLCEIQRQVDREIEDGTFTESDDSETLRRLVRRV